MKIVVLDGRTLNSDRNAWAGLDSLGEVAYYEISQPEDVLERAVGATILVTNKFPLRRDLIAKLPDLKFITVTATGFDCVDLDAARERGIPVSNVPEYSTHSVAQFTFALLLELCQQVGLHAEAVKAGEWTNQPDFSLRKTPLVELAGKTLGIAGYGRIGRRVADVASVFGMNVVAYRPSGKVDREGDSVATCTLDELFERSDVVSLHCPLTDTTKGMVNRERLQRARPGMLLINTARGALIVEQDLADALNAGEIAGAAVDVVTREPIPADNPLLKAKNCLITPHIAWTTNEARERLLESSIANIKAFLAGKPVNVVN
ncbi:MAG: D-2-hydroxyacid dehydrogenase [Paludisphaera borealis]|uniref:D-2-hydroxyacid dehydrogenase n=1 Tax=Paludisphaera borealis TaxID=1387353 RepID=UPI00284AD068|nr:D-2-hydroxyacid dehydrogenase [Paludisphaera borealis]MDR3618922.1 D-2-hydroxyacid dehydrogenase [Paludisphaera borealis]